MGCRKFGLHAVRNGPGCWQHDRDGEVKGWFVPKVVESYGDDG